MPRRLNFLTWPKKRGQPTTSTALGKRLFLYSYEHFSLSFTRLVKGLYEGDWSKEKVGQLFLLIDSMIMLPEDLATAFEEEMAAFEEEKKVRYISSVERHGMEKGRVIGRVIGRAEGLIEGMGLLLEEKFGKAALALLPKVRSLGEYAEVRKFSRYLKKAKSLDEVRDYFA